MNIKELNPAELANLVADIKEVGTETGWIKATQLTHLDLILSQLYRAQADLIKARGSK